MGENVNVLSTIILSFVLTLAGQDSDDKFQKLVELGRRAEAKGNYAEAERHFRSAVDLADAGGVSIADRSAAFSDLGHLLLEEDRLAESEEFFDRALEIARSSPGGENNLPILLGGKGGGRPDMAEAGGKDPQALPAALEAVYKSVEKML